MATGDQEDGLSQRELDCWIRGWTEGGQQSAARTLVWLRDRGYPKAVAIDFLQFITRRATESEAARADHLVGLAHIRQHGHAREA